MPPAPNVPAAPLRVHAATGLQAVGVALFLFIPLVLFLFVRHPAPLGASLAAGIVLMLGHRFAARPYMRRAVPRKCVWCNRALPPPGDPATRTLALASGGGQRTEARSCARHLQPAGRFFRCLDRARWPLRLGIFLPLLLLLAALAAGAAGRPARLDAATAWFQLLVGLTVSAASLGYRLCDPPAGERSGVPIGVPFPLHNFLLLGVHPLLWIFRLVGAWWIVRGARVLLGG
jgi:hypothetical protein